MVFDFRSEAGKLVQPHSWLHEWAAMYPTSKYDDDTHDRLLDTFTRPAEASAENFEDIGRWKDVATSADRWKPNVATVAYGTWKEIAKERPRCPADGDLTAFLDDWSSRTDTYQYAFSRTVKRFGLARATTLLYFISGGRFPIFASQAMRPAIKKLCGVNVPNTVPAYVTIYCPFVRQLVDLCGAANLREVDRALFSYGRRR